MNYLSRPESPCKRDCKFRSAFCRIDCEDYAEYQEKYKQYADAKRKKIEAEGEYLQYIKNIKQKMNKNRRR